MRFLIAIALISISITCLSQTTNIVILNSSEIQNLRSLLTKNEDLKKMRDSILTEANFALACVEKPLEIMHYEGLLNTDPKRINTVESFTNIESVITLIYASYLSENTLFDAKAKSIILSWTKTYKPTGNPINENKFNAFYWGYYLFKSQFSKNEQKLVENWMLEIAKKEMNRDYTPNNNWNAKRFKITGIIGSILNNEEIKNFAIEGFKTYIETAYFPDGTSNDLKSRDALHYHVSGITPCLSAFINLSKFDEKFDLYAFVSPSGSSIQKSVEYVVPYATGIKQRKEWTNTTVQLDKDRAAAGLAEYQPGILFDPKEAFSMFEWACYYNRDWFGIFQHKNENAFTSSWIGLLNSPLIRGNKFQ